MSMILRIKVPRLILYLVMFKSVNNESQIMKER